MVASANILASFLLNLCRIEMGEDAHVKLNCSVVLSSGTRWKTLIVTLGRRRQQMAGGRYSARSNCFAMRSSMVESFDWLGEVNLA